MDRRFVIQLHRTGEGSHYDLMIEHGPDAPLATWRVGVLPGDLPRGGAAEATAMPDHRRRYLDYEGPISGDRGTVEIADAGKAAVAVESAGRWEVELAGCGFAGRFVLTRDQGDRWSLSRL